MVPSAQQARTSLALLAAGSALVAAALLGPASPAETPVCIDRPAPDALGMRVDARFTSRQILHGEQDVAVTITAPAAPTTQRPPLALAILIDRSGSMNGTPLDNAKAAAKQLVAELDQNDAFSIVTFSSGDETVAPMALATPSTKLAAERAIDAIMDGGGTCTSCGLTRATRELDARPAQDRLRRIVLMSDGQANEGIWDRPQLVAFAGKIAAHGTSISTVGVGLDFDEVTMTNIANVGHGNYYFVEDTRNLGAMFARELSGLTATVATGAQLSINETDNLQVLEAYGYPLVHTADGQALVPIADLRAGETRKVVLHVRVAAAGHGVASLVFTRVSDDKRGVASADVFADVTDDRNAIATSVDHEATRAVEEALSAKALEEATVTYQRDGYQAAKNVLEKRTQIIHDQAGAIADPDIVQKLDAANGEALKTFATTPAPKAMKAVRSKSYELAR